MQHRIPTPAALAEAIRAVRKASGVRQDDLAAQVGVSRQFAVDLESGKPTVQLGLVMRVLEELGMQLSVELPDEALRLLQTPSPKPQRRR